MFVGFELDKFEWPGADRMLAHLVWGLMTRSDRRESVGQQHRECRLPSLQMKGDLVVVIRAHRFEVLEVRLARVEADPVLGLVELQIDRAQHVLGGERLAVVPFDALAQGEGQRRAVLVPLPFGRQVGLDRLDADQRVVLVEQDQVVVDRHQWRLAERRCLLVNIEARRAVGVVDPEGAARLLGRG